jgi:hypothetical protein
VTVTRILLAAGLAATLAAGAWALLLRSSDDSHSIWVGALEDAVKQPDPATADARVALATRAGFNVLAITTLWTLGQSEPDPAELTLLRNAAEASRRKHIRLLVSVFGSRARYAPLDAAGQAEYAAYVAKLARELPTIRDFVIWNEPNLNGFWLYQFDGSGRDIAAPAYTALLAASYDALKAVSPKITVYGGALAPRGDDNPDAPRKTQSPTVFIRDMGSAYRASGRTEPIMDVFAIHPYNVRSALPPTTTHPIGTAIGIADYDKLVGLLRDAFDGTAQPGSKLPIAYTEYGVQTTIPPDHVEPYTNLQSPLASDAVDEQTQADYYRQAFQFADCQPTVVGILVFHLIDEPDLNRWQSGPYYADGPPKSSLDDIRRAAEDARHGKLGGCP